MSIISAHLSSKIWSFNSLGRCTHATCCYMLQHAHTCTLSIHIQENTTCISRKRWIEDIEEDIQIMGIRGWRKLCKESVEWKKIAEKAKNPQWVVMPVKEEEDYIYLKMRNFFSNSSCK
jgi:hypothetical protein